MSITRCAYVLVAPMETEMFLASHCGYFAAVSTSVTSQFAGIHERHQTFTDNRVDIKKRFRQMAALWCLS